MSYSFWRRQNSTWTLICSAIAEHSRFCQPLLSVIFPFIVLVQCYLLYAATTNLEKVFQQTTFYFQWLCLLTTLEFNVLLLLLTSRCSAVQRYNRQFTVECARYCFAQQMSSNKHNETKCRLRLLKVRPPFAFFILSIVSLKMIFFVD